jgi:hypothetical protein
MMTEAPKLPSPNRPAPGDSVDAARPAEAASSPPPRDPSEASSVLSTLNDDGTRRWLQPRVSPGRFLTARRLVAYALIALFALLPSIQIHGKPLILLDIIARR